MRTVKLKTFRLVVVLLICCVGFNARATHIIGGEISYSLAFGNTYNVTLSLVGDCAGSAFPYLVNATPHIDVLKNGGAYTTITLSQQSFADITPVCQAESGNTTCNNVNGFLPGVKRFIYMGQVTIDNTTTATWTFQFNGVVTAASQAGRSSSITNIVNGGSSLMQLEAKLYRSPTVISNSSPTYTTVPTPFFCINKPANYNPGVVDANGDSLVFALTPGLQYQGATPTVVYNAGYSATMPLSTVSNAFSFSTTNGQLTFTPNIAQSSLVVYLTQEYKNGILVGTSMREMNFIVLSSCNNNAAGGTIITTNGGTIGGTSNTNVTVCPGQSNFNFTLSATDPDNDTVVVTAAGIPNGAIFTVANNNTLNPIVTFGWSTVNVTPGVYSIFLTFTDKGCPLSSTQTLAYTITVADAVSPTPHDTAFCQFSLADSLHATGQNLLWYTTATGGTGSAQAPVPSTATVGTQTYYVSRLVGTCESPRVPLVVTIKIKPSTPTATPDSFTYCQGYTALPLSATGTSLLYYHPITSTGVSSLTPSTLVVGLDSFFVTQTVNGCISDKARIKVRVLPAPTPTVSATSYTYCQYETPTPLTATGTGVKWYTTATGGTASSTPPTVSTFLPGTFKYYATQTNANGCESIRLAITIIVNAKPAPPTVTTPVRYCQYAAADPLTVTIGSNLKWYDTAAGGLGSGVAPVPVTSYEDTVSYWVTQTVNGCESDRTLIKVMVTAKPNGIILSKKKFVCQYDTDTLYYYGNARPGYTVDWKVPSISGAIIDSIGRDTIIVRFDSAGSIPVRMQVNYNGCLSDEFIYNVDVRPLPIVRITTPSDVCINQKTTVALDQSFITDVDHYVWDFDGGLIAAGVSLGGPYTVSWATSGTKVITVLATRQQCSRSYTDTLMIHDLPQTVIKADYSSSFCAGDTAKLEADIPIDSVGIYKIRWTPGIFYRYGYGFDSTAYKTLAIVTTSEPISLYLTDRYGCVGKSSIGIDAKPCCEVYLPDAFTPNGDGRNEYFKMLTVGHHQIANFRVVDRWGKTVFETANEQEGWNGTLGGKPQEVGTYFYYLRYQCENGNYYDKKGEVTLIR